MNYAFPFVFNNSGHSSQPAFESAFRSWSNAAAQQANQVIKAQEQFLTTWTKQGVRPEQTVFAFNPAARTVLGEKADELAAQTAELINRGVTEAGNIIVEFNKAVLAIAESHDVEGVQAGSMEQNARRTAKFAREAMNLQVETFEKSVKALSDQVNEAAELFGGILDAAVKSEPVKVGGKGKGRQN